MKGDSLSRKANRKSQKLFPFVKMIENHGVVPIRLSSAMFFQCLSGYIGPGGLHESKLHENCTGGAAGYIDRVVLGEKHLYGNPTPKVIQVLT